MNEIIVMQGKRAPLIEAYLANCAPATREAYSRDWLLFYSFVGKPLREVREADVVRYIKSLKGKNNTVNRRIYSVSKLYGLLAKEGLVPYDVVERVRTTMKVTKPVPKPAPLDLTKEDIDTVVRDATPQTGCIVAMLANSGLRISELLALKHSDCTMLNGYTKLFIRGKGSKERVQYVHTPVYEKCREVWPTGEYVIGSRNRSSVWRMVHRAFKRYTGKEVKNHDLRKWYTVHQIKAGKSPKSVSVGLGHSDVSLTLRVYENSSVTPDDLLLAQ